MTAPADAAPRTDAELVVTPVRELARRPDDERERGAELLAARLDRPFTVLGLLFLLVVLGQNVATSPGVQRVFAAVGTVLWVLFVGEFLLRLWLAPSKTRFLKRNWWQVLFLVLPALRFLRGLALLRVVRAGRLLRVVRAGGVVSSAVRSSRSAGHGAGGPARHLVGRRLRRPRRHPGRLLPPGRAEHGPRRRLLRAAPPAAPIKAPREPSAGTVLRSPWRK